MAFSRNELATKAGWGAVLLALVGVIELGAQLFFSQRAPRFDDYALLAEPLSSLRRDGDLLVMAPRWSEPLARRALGDEAMSLADVARPDESGYEHAVEVSLRGEHERDLAGWGEVERRTVGPFTLRRLRNPSARPALVDFVAELSPRSATVAMAPGAPCVWTERAPLSAGGLGGHPTFPRQRFVCAGSPFMNVGVTVIADQDFRPRRCIWAHPPARGELQLTFSEVALGEEIVGHGGIYWMVERERRGAPVELAVQIDGEEVGRVIHADGDGWAPFRLPLGEHAGKKAARVRFAVSSPDNRHRHFCFEARSR